MITHSGLRTTGSDRGHVATGVPEADRLRAYLMGRCLGRLRSTASDRPASMRAIPCELVDVRETVPGLVILDAPAWSDPERRFRVRPEVAVRLARAVVALPENMRLGFWEGLRPVCVQHDLWSHGLEYFRCAYPLLTPAELEPLLEQYVARPIGSVPPHSTGSAVDVAAVDGFGRILTPEDSWGRMGTELMARALHGAGLANYAPEWWHWSYGDDEWARVYDCAPLPFSRTSREELDEGPGDGI